MKKLSLLKTVLLLCALIVGSSSVWAQTILYSWDGNGSTTTANETGGTASAVQASGTNIAVGISQKGNYCLKMNKGFAKGANYIEITLEEELSGGETITIGAFRASDTGAVLGVDFGDTGTQSLKDDTDVISSGTGTPTDWEFTVPAEAAGSTTVRLYRNSGSTGMWVSKVVIATASSDPSSDAKFANETPSISFPAQKTFTQTATTAKGYSGTVTYAITENTAGATIDGATLTVTKGGIVTVRATAPAVEDEFAQSTATYTLTVNDTRAANDLAFAEATQNVNVGEVLTAPTLTNPHDLTVTYSSSDESVATVDENTGDVTGVYGGSATITATFAGDDDYLGGSASYTVNVQKVRPANALLFETFDTNDQTGGNDGTWSSISSTPTPAFDNNGWTYTGYAASECVRTAKSGHFTTPALGFSGDATLTFKMASWGNDTNNGYVDILNGGTFDGDEKTQTLVSIKKSEWDTFTLELKDITPETQIKFHDNGNSKRLFLDEVCIVATKEAVTVSELSWNTFSSAYALDFTSVSTAAAYMVTNASGNTLTLAQVTGTIPANTGLLISGTADADLDIPVVASSETATTSNLLKAGTGETISGATKYVLVKRDNKAAFASIESHTPTIAKGKAYLDLDGVTLARDFFFLDEETTGISEVTATSMFDGAIYNLNGARVTKPGKGLYIMNGKKVVIK